MGKFNMSIRLEPNLTVNKNNVIKCPHCHGMTPIIDRFNHNVFNNCPLCKGKKFIKIRNIVRN